MVEGPIFAAVNHVLQSSIEIVECVYSRNSQRFISELKQDRVPSFVTTWPIGKRMHLTIDLDRQPPLQTHEVKYVTGNWELPSKSESTWLFP